MINVDKMNVFDPPTSIDQTSYDQKLDASLLFSIYMKISENCEISLISDSPILHQK